MSTTALAGTDAAEDLGTGRVSLRVRLVTGAVLLVLLTVGITGTVSWFIADQKLVQTASDRLRDAAKTFAFLYEQRIEAARSVGQQIAEEVAFAVQQHELDTAASTEGEGLIEQKRAAITLILEPIRDLHPHYSLAVTDANGRVVARSAPEGAKLPNTTLYHLPGVPHALQGERPPPAIVYQADGLDNTCALAMSVATPILGVGQELLGAVYVAYPLDQAFTEQIKDDIGLDSSIYCLDRLAATTFPGLQQALGQSADVRVRDGVLGQGKSSERLIRVFEANMLTLYEPLLTLAGKRIGMYAVGVPAHTLADDRESLLRVFLPVIGSIALAAIAVGYAGAMRLTRPLRRLTNAAEQISQGDLQTPIAITGDDEVALLASRMEEMRRSLQQTYENLTELNKLKDEYLFSVAHEVRTPLTALLATVEILASDYELMTPAELRSAVERIARSSVRLSTLVDNVLDAGSIRAGRFDIYVTPTRLDVVCGQAIATVRPLLEERGQRVVRDLPDTLPLLLADRNRLVQVLTNLLTNAIKYAPAGDDIVIEATWQGETATPGQVRIAVTDHGAGIPLPDQATVFERYFRSATTPQGSPGTGLGLSIAKAIVEAHGGRIGLTSDEGVGTTVWFTIPVASRTMPGLHDQMEIGAADRADQPAAARPRRERAGVGR